jgi:hypothetical protein
MFPRPLALIAALTLLTLPLAGCGIPGGIAYAIKEGAKEVKKQDGNGNDNAGQQQTDSAPASTSQPLDTNPPPAPVAAPRDAITVETLK